MNKEYPLACRIFGHDTGTKEYSWGTEFYSDVCRRKKCTYKLSKHSRPLSLPSVTPPSNQRIDIYVHHRD